MARRLSARAVTIFIYFALLASAPESRAIGYGDIPNNERHYNYYEVLNTAYQGYQAYEQKSGSTATTPAPPEPIGFECTAANGMILGCTNLSSSCSPWWPACAKKAVPPPQQFPRNCDNAAFKLLHYPVEDTGQYTSAKDYSHDAAPATVAVPSHSELSPTPVVIASAYFAAPVSTGAASPAPQANNAAPAPPLADPTSAGLPAGSSATPEKTVSSASNGAAAIQVISNSAKNSPYGEGRSLASTTENVAGFKPPYKAENASGAGNGSSSNFTDPWMDYVSSSGSHEQMVVQLRSNPRLREDLRQKLVASLHEGNGTDPKQKERIEYFRNALTEADKRADRSLETLAPLESQEAFSMSGDETDREINRLLAGMNAEAAPQEEGPNYSLFPRIHRALWRQISNGNVNLPQLRRTKGN